VKPSAVAATIMRQRRAAVVCHRAFGRLPSFTARSVLPLGSALMCRIGKVAKTHERTPPIPNVSQTLLAADRPCQGKTSICPKALTFGVRFL
jgi:hypothetical protein